MDILSYQPQEWDRIFIAERDNLHFLLPQYKFNVEHIGATAIPNCRSFRNVDILISLHSFKDIYTVAMLLESKEYKRIEEYSSIDCITLVKKYKYGKIGVTVRIVEYGGKWYNRAQAFQVILKESYDRTQKYNIFRENLFRQYYNDIKKYNEIKYDYINSQIDYYFKFEE